VTSRANRSHAKDQLRGMIEIAERRVAEAEAIGWPALAASWREDLRALRAQVEQRDNNPELEAK